MSHSEHPVTNHKNCTHPTPSYYKSLAVCEQAVSTFKSVASDLHLAMACSTSCPQLTFAAVAIFRFPRCIRGSSSLNTTAGFFVNH